MTDTSDTDDKTAIRDADSIERMRKYLGLDGDDEESDESE